MTDEEVAADMWRRCSPGVDLFQMIVIEGNPPRKLRPRFNSKTGVTYPDPQQEQDEAMTGAALRRVVRTPLEGNVGLACVFYREDRHVIDADNLLKHVADSGNRILWGDDSQVTCMLAVVEVDAARPRTVVCVGAHFSSMDRSTAVRRVRKSSPSVGMSLVGQCRVCGKPVSRGSNGLCRACRGIPPV